MGCEASLIYYLYISFFTQFHWFTRQKNPSFFAAIPLLVTVTCPSPGWLEQSYKYSELLFCLQSSTHHGERGWWRWEGGRSPLLTRIYKKTISAALVIFSYYLLSSWTLQLPVPLAKQCDRMQFGTEKRDGFLFFPCLKAKGGFLGNGIIYF